jgi:hypothetical protein
VKAVAAVAVLGAEAEADPGAVVGDLVASVVAEAVVDRAAVVVVEVEGAAVVVVAAETAATGAVIEAAEAAAAGSLAIQIWKLIFKTWSPQQRAPCFFRNLKRNLVVHQKALFPAGK